MSLKSSVMNTLLTNSCQTQVKVVALQKRPRYQRKLLHQPLWRLYGGQRRTNLDVVVLLGAVLVKQAAGSRLWHKQDGLEGDLALGGKVDVGKGVITVLLAMQPLVELYYNWFHMQYRYFKDL